MTPWRQNDLNKLFMTSWRQIYPNQTFIMSILDCLDWARGMRGFSRFRGYTLVAMETNGLFNSSHIPSIFSPSMVPIAVHKHWRRRRPNFSWWKVAWKNDFWVSMVTPWVFLDASIFPVTLGPRPTLSWKPRQNRTKIEEILKHPTSEFYIRDITQIIIDNRSMIQDTQVGIVLQQAFWGGANLSIAT